MKMVFNYLKKEIQQEIQCKAREETMSRTPSQKVINRRVQSEIDQENLRITQLAQESTEHEEKLVQHQLDIDSIKSSVENKVEFKRKQCGTNQLVLEDCRDTL